VASTGRRVVFGGDVYLTIRLADGTLTLTPEWDVTARGCRLRDPFGSAALRGAAA
jgi:hypothetical protein